MEVDLATVGRKTRELRLAQGLRLADLAEMTGYSTTYLSQIERGICIPSLTALASVAMALGVEMTALFDLDTRPKVHITRSGDGPEILLPSDSLSFRVVASHGGDGAYTAIVQGLPDTPTRYRHFGERFVLVLDGSVRFSFGDEHHDLETDDTLHYSSHETHETTHTGDGRLQLLILSSPALL